MFGANEIPWGQMLDWVHPLVPALWYSMPPAVGRRSLSSMQFFSADMHMTYRCLWRTHTEDDGRPSVDVPTQFRTSDKPM